MSQQWHDDQAYGAKIMALQEEQKAAEKEIIKIALENPRRGWTIDMAIAIQKLRVIMKMIADVEKPK